MGLCGGAVTRLPEFRLLPRLGSSHNKTRESVLNHRITLCAGLSALAVAAATSAQAQVYVEPPRGYVEPPSQMVHGGLPPTDVLMAVRASGLRPLTQPARRGSQYVLLASDNMGGQLRVVVSHNGRIVHAEPAYDPRFAYAPVRPRGLVPIGPPQHAAVAPPQYAAPPADLRTPSAPPPRTARAAPAQQAPGAAGPSQNHNLASAPDGASASPARPVSTPLPRPRPAVASNEVAAPAAAPETAPQAAPSAPAAAAQPASPPPAASTAPARPAAAETQMVPVAPLD